MVNILLVCSAGMSTSLLVNKMKEAADQRGIEVNIKAVPDADAKTSIEKYDCMLLGPQVRFMLAKMKEFAGDKPVEVIDMATYAVMDGAKALDQALRMLGQA